MVDIVLHYFFKTNTLETNPPKKERNKDNSRQQFLLAVGTIMKTKGYAALKINHIAAEAGLDKKLIYKYFGGKEGLLREYIQYHDFWSNVKDDKVPTVITDGGREFIKAMLTEQFQYLSKNKELQKILLWRLSEEQPYLRQLTELQEENGEALFAHLTDPYFNTNAQDFRAVAAILVSGIYYLNMYAELNGSVFCGIDLQSENGQEKIKDALALIVDNTFSALKNKK